MTYEPLLISLPVADRVRAHAFYRDALGLEAVGEPADDGVPEPAPQPWGYASTFAARTVTSGR